jgi:hypothetical protein
VMKKGFIGQERKYTTIGHFIGILKIEEALIGITTKRSCDFRSGVLGTKNLSSCPDGN